MVESIEHGNYDGVYLQRQCDHCARLMYNCLYFEKGYEPVESRIPETEFMRGMYFAIRGRCSAYYTFPSKVTISPDRMSEELPRKCQCGNKIVSDNCVIVVTNGEPEYFCCGECYR